jgi:hypothetical protein
MASAPTKTNNTKKSGISAKKDGSPSFSERQHKVIKDQGLKIESVPITMISEENK